MYRYYQCKRNAAHRMVVPVHESGAYAQPACNVCMGPTISLGEGEAPILPPMGAPPVPPPAGELTDEKVLVLSGTGNHQRLGKVDYYLKKNDAQVDAILTVKVGQKVNKVRFHVGLLGGNTSEAQVRAPGGASWLTIATKTDAMDRMGVILTNPPVMDKNINFSMKVGNAVYGLVHVIAGHHDDLRTLTGAGVVQVTDGSDTSEAKKQNRKMEQYRSYIAVQAGLQECLGPGKLQAIYKVDAVKWIFVGLWGEKCFLVVTQKNGINYDITTLYIGAPGGVNAVAGGGNRVTAWKRKMAKLPSGW